MTTLVRMGDRAPAARPGALRRRVDRVAARARPRGRRRAGLPRHRSRAWSDPASRSRSSTCSRRPGCTSPCSMASSRTRGRPRSRRVRAPSPAFGMDGTVVVPVGGGSSMDAAKVMALHAANGGEVLALGYHRDDLAPGLPVIAVPTTAGTGAETNTYGVITDEAAGRKDYVGHPSVLPAWSVLDPALTVGVPPAATAATGCGCPDPLPGVAAVAEPEPVRGGASRSRSSGPSASGCHGRWPTARTSRHARSCSWPRTSRGSASRAGRASGSSMRSGTPSGRAGSCPHGLALAVVEPEVLAFYAAEPGLRDRELHLVGVALGAASPTETAVDGRGRGDRRASRASCPGSGCGRRSARSASTTRSSTPSPRTPSTTRRSATRRGCRRSTRPARSSRRSPSPSPSVVGRAGHEHRGERLLGAGLADTAGPRTRS